jgi:serine phosphatase RsbU (regulator of sigma subunit)
MVTFFKSLRAPSAPSPPPVQAEVPHLRDAGLAAVYYGQRMAGDFYDFIRVAPDRVIFGLLDVAGRDMDCRPVLLAAQATFRGRSQELFRDEEINEAEAMVELCHDLNRSIMQAASGVRSCAAFAGCYREDLGTICYFNAGHTPGLFRTGDVVTELPATGLPLGLFSHATCDAPTIAVPPSAAMLLVSRGILEGKRKHEEFGLDRVKQTFRQTTASKPRELCISILHELQQFMGTPPTHNDVTTVALMRT